MPYCSIEEAWGPTFNKKKNSLTANYRNIVPDNAKHNLDEYADIDFDTDNTYTSSTSPGKQVLGKEKKKKRRKSFSRTMNRLPDTSGPKNRYVPGDNYKQLQFSDNVNSNSIQTKTLRDQTKATYKNTDVPISDFNKDLEQDLYNKQSLSNRELSDEEDEIDFVEDGDRDREDIYDEEEERSYDEEEGTYDEQTTLHDKHTNTNTRIPRQLENYKDLELHSLEKDRVNRMKDNMFDIIVYVITGIFLIFILDLFVRLGKNTKN